MPEEELHAIRIHLDRLLADRGMTLSELSAQVDITVVNLSVLKNGRAKAIRFSTLSRICDVLGCRPGDLITHDLLQHASGHRGRQGPQRRSHSRGTLRQIGIACQRVDRFPPDLRGA